MADRILADPTRRKLFEKENLYNLLTMPSGLEQTQIIEEKEESTPETESESEEGHMRK